MALYLEVTFIDSDNQARKTPHGAMGKDDEETKALFEANRPFEADSETCDFLLDLKESDQSIIVDTICLNSDRVAFLIGEPVKSETEYRQFDSGYWADAQAIFDGMKQAG